MRILAVSSLLLLPALLPGGVSSDLSQQLRHSTLDPEECYRVRDIRFTRDEIKLYLTEGLLIFSKPVNGVRVSAVFSADVNGGDAELLLMPPSVSERKSLAAFAKTPNLNEHFTDSVMLFTDDSANELLEMVKSAGAKKSPEMGNLLMEKWNPIVKNFIGSFEVRLVEDLLSPHRAASGFFYVALGGNPLGNFDVIYDPRTAHQISVGQIAFRNDRRFFDIWTNFASLSFRRGFKKQAPPALKIERVRIDATIHPDLLLQAVSRIQVKPARRERTIALELSQRMRVTEVKIDGKPGEGFSPESLRANLLRSGDNNILLITGDQEFAEGQTVELEIHHEGTVISQAGDDVFFVGARGIWYPNRSGQFADYEVVFRYPRALDLVATGDLLDEQQEGDWKISRRKSASPVRIFGFNLGRYERAKITRSGLSVEVCANRKLETALHPRPRPVEFGAAGTPPFSRGPRRPGNSELLTLPPPPIPNPIARLQQIASDVALSFAEMTQRFGKPPTSSLTVSPIPGRFGQGFPGLVYLSTITYLDPSDRPLARGDQGQQIFFSELLHAHEVGHQWWGNGVSSADYQDDWLMEALANYSAVWAFERKKGARALDTLLDDFRSNLLRKEEDGRTLESAGPVTMGLRLFSSQFPTAWPVITYEKGAWIIHMLRRRLGDERFAKMLAQLYQRYLFQAVTTEQFQKVAAEFLPPGSVDPKLENFFEQWVHSTGIPEWKLNWSISGKAPRVKLIGTITQSEVGENFGAWVPVEIQTALRGKPIVQWIQTSSEPVQFTVNLAAPPVKVSLDPGNTTLSRR